MQRERDRSGAIVAAIIEGPVPATANVGLMAERVHCPYRCLHVCGRTRGCVGDPVTQNRPISADCRTFAARSVLGFVKSGSPIALFIRIDLVHSFRAQNVRWFRARRIGREPDRFHSNRGRDARNIVNKRRCNVMHSGMDKRERLQRHAQGGLSFPIPCFCLGCGTAEKNREREINQDSSAASATALLTTQHP